MGTPGKYAVLAKVADGGMAEIFLGTQFGAAGFERRVILKRLRPELLTDKELRQSLLDEAQIAMRLHHGNIAHVLDVGEASGHLFLVLELVDGWSLDQLLKRSRALGERVPLELIVYIAAELCRGLAYAHGLSEDGVSLNIVHRDISPHNVLLSEEGAVKLTDFGIARATIREDRTGIGVVKGKPNYMSPEQALGQPLDARSDLFSVGTLLYQLVTDVLPFKGNDDYGSLLKVQAAKFTPPSKLREGLPRGLVRLINKALEREPGDRFDSAQQMLEALEKLLRTEFEPAGQSELKRYLAALSQRDGQLALSKRVAVPKAAPPAKDPDAWIELSDVLPGVKTTSNRPNAAVSGGAVGTRRVRALPVAVALLALAGAAASLLWSAQQPGPALSGETLAGGGAGGPVVGEAALGAGVSPAPSNQEPSSESALEASANEAAAEGEGSSAASTVIAARVEEPALGSSASDPSPGGAPPSGISPDGSSPSGTSPSRNSPSGTSPSGTSPSGTSPSGTSPSGTSPSGTSPSGTSPSGALPSGALPSGALPSGTSPSGSSPSGSSPSGTSPSGTSLSGTSSSGTSPSGTSPGGTSPGGTSPGGTSPGGTSPSGTSPSGTSPGGTSPSGASPSGTSPSGTSPGGTSPTGTSPSGTSPSGTSPSGTSPGGTSPSSASPSSTSPGGTSPSSTSRGRGSQRTSEVAAGDDAGVPATQFVRFESDPRGASVSVDGRVLGTTPTSLRFRTGVLFEVTFAVAGKEPVKRRFTVSGLPGQRVFTRFKAR